MIHELLQTLIKPKKCTSISCNVPPELQKQFLNECANCAYQTETLQSMSKADRTQTVKSKLRSNIFLYHAVCPIKLHNIVV